MTRRWVLPNLPGARQSAKTNEVSGEYVWKLSRSLSELPIHLLPLKLGIYILFQSRRFTRSLGTQKWPVDVELRTVGQRQEIKRTYGVDVVAK